MAPSSKKNTWEFRTYWQHVEQYALDPNLLDSDFFEGRGNLEGIYTALAYSFTDNVIATFRYGYASRINDKLGTGGSNLDIPQMNPIQHYNLLQLDLTLRFLIFLWAAGGGWTIKSGDGPELNARNSRTKP